MKPTPIIQSVLKILLCLLVIAACFFHSRLLPLSGLLNIIVSIVALLLTIISIREIYKAVCSIIHELDP